MQPFSALAWEKVKIKRKTFKFPFGNSFSMMEWNLLKKLMSINLNHFLKQKRNQFQMEETFSSGPTNMEEWNGIEVHRMESL